MLVSNLWCEETAKEIICGFEQLLSDYDIIINHENSIENKFETENSCINIKDYNKLKEEITKQLKQFADYVEYKIEDVA